MAGGIDWFRWHHGSVTDPKFQLVARKASARFGDVMTVWAFVLEAASADADRGHVGAIDAEAIDLMLGAEDGTTDRILSAMQERGLIDGERISSWDKRQPKRERPDDNSTERTRAFREKQRQETPENATERQETPRGEESREEKKEEKRAREPSGSRLPLDWVMPDEWAAWAKEARPDLDPIITSCRFADYWHGKPGKDGRKADWLATWRNWVRGEKSAQGMPAQAVSRPHTAPSETAEYLRSLDAHKPSAPPKNLFQLREQA